MRTIKVLPNLCLNPFVHEGGSAIHRVPTEQLAVRLPRLVASTLVRLDGSVVASADPVSKGIASVPLLSRSLDVDVPKARLPCHILARLYQELRHSLPATRPSD